MKTLLLSALSIGLISCQSNLGKRLTDGLKKTPPPPALSEEQKQKLADEKSLIEQTQDLRDDEHIRNNVRLIQDFRGTAGRKIYLTHLTDDYIENSIREVERRNRTDENLIVNKIASLKKFAKGKTCFMATLSSNNEYDSALLKTWLFKLEKDGKFFALPVLSTEVIPSIHTAVGNSLDVESTHVMCRNELITRPFTVRAINQSTSEEWKFIWD